MGYEDLFHAGRGPDVPGVARRSGARWLIASKKDRWPQLRAAKSAFRPVRALPEQTMTTGVAVTLDRLFERDPNAPEPTPAPPEKPVARRRRPQRPRGGPG
jgi:hypothetical protein